MIGEKLGRDVQETWGLGAGQGGGCGVPRHPELGSDDLDKLGFWAC